MFPFDYSVRLLLENFPGLKEYISELIKGFMFNEFEFTICVYFLNKMGFFLEDIKDLLGIQQTNQLCVKLYFVMALYASKDYCNSNEHMGIFKAYVNESDVSPWFTQHFRDWTRKKQHYLKIVPSDLNLIYKRFQNQIFEVVNEDIDYNYIVERLVAPKSERNSFVSQSKRSGRNDDSFTLNSLYGMISREEETPKIEVCGNYIVPPMQKLIPTIQANDLCTICRRNNSQMNECSHFSHSQLEKTNENPQVPEQMAIDESQPQLMLHISKVPSFWNENQNNEIHEMLQMPTLMNQSSFQLFRNNSTMQDSNNPFN